MLNDYVTSLIQDYISNVDPFTVKNIEYLEEYIMISNETPATEDFLYADAVYYLYNVTDTNDNSHYFILVVNENLQMVIKATDEVLADLFPHILKKNDV